MQAAPVHDGRALTLARDVALCGVCEGCAGMSRADSLYLHLLAERGQCISRLAAQLQWGRKTVRKHLRTLIADGRAALIGGRSHSRIRPPIYVAQAMRGVNA